MFTTPKGIIFFILGSVILILLMTAFVSSIVYKYQKKQINYRKNLEILKQKYQNLLLQSQIEIQEQTFQYMAQEIHDNIGQKLTLVKLILNTINIDHEKYKINTTDLVNMISEVISDLSDVSRSISSNIILSNGLIKALEREIAQIKKLKSYEIDLSVSGNTLFLDAGKELIIFRIMQEALNNILKHANATEIKVHLDYTPKTLALQITDNGMGFDKVQKMATGNGLQNMSNRTELLNGTFSINSVPRRGTTINIEIPYHTKLQLKPK